MNFLGILEKKPLSYFEKPFYKYSVLLWLWTVVFMSAYLYCVDFCKIFTFTGSLKKDVGDYF